MRWLALLCALASSTCAGTYGEYVCPAPVGAIVRDDCDVYRTRYESLKVDLGFSLGGVGVSVKAGQESLRDPSETLQLLAHQSLQLCRDFNACRVAPGEYREKRERADVRFTALTAIAEQLKSPATDAATRARLLEELIAVITDAPRAQGRAKEPPRAPERAFRRASETFVDAVVQPPRARPVAPGVPDVVGFSRSAETKKLWLSLRGHAKADVQEDDAVLAGEPPLRCTVRRIAPRGGGSSTGRAECAGVLPERFEVRYRPGASGAESALGTLDTSLDWRRQHAFVAFAPEPLDEPVPRSERAYLVVHARPASPADVYARCTVDGKPLEGALRSRDQNSSLGEGLRRHHVALPLVVDSGARRASHPGAWQCAVSASAAPLGVARFTVGADGRVTDGEAAGLRRPPWWPVRWSPAPQ